MTANSPPGFFATLFKQLRRLTHTFHDKPASLVDECELEHFLIYHGLVGSSPENQRSFRDVRADIIEAVKRQSAVDLAIALKLPPQWWEEKLKTIFGEIAASNRAGALATLLPAGDAESPETASPLSSQDWRVRANAAGILAFLEAPEATAPLARALGQAAGNSTFKPSFPYLAQALGALATDDARAALQEHLYADEPWFRVDAVRALSEWEDSQTTSAVMRSLTRPQPLSDYAAVAVAQRRPIVELLSSSDPETRAGALEVVLGVIAASEHTFQSDAVTDTGVHKSWPALRKLSRDEKSIRALRASTSLARWLMSHRFELAPEEIVDAAGNHPSMLELMGECESELDRLDDAATGDTIIAALEKGATADTQHDSGLQHAIQLAGEQHLGRATPHLVSLLGSPFVDDVVDALGAIGNKEIAAGLIELAEKTVDIDGRQSPVPSAQPLSERDPESARTYWHILGALGDIGDARAIPLLLRAAGDVAPDKRQQALAALLKVCRTETPPPAVRSTVERALTDPASSVRAAALEAVASLSLADLIPGVVRLADAKEVSLRTRAFDVLKELADKGEREHVKAAVEARLRAEFDQHRRARLEKLLQSLG